MVIVNGIEFYSLNIGEYYITKNGVVAKIKVNDNEELKFFQLIEWQVGHNGYARVQLSNKKKYLVHRLVAKIFLDNFTEECVINHIDNNTLNNNVDNLEVTDQKGNIHHAISQGRFKINGRKEISIRDKETGIIHTFASRMDMTRFLGYSESYTKGMKATTTKKFKEKYEVVSQC